MFGCGVRLPAVRMDVDPFDEVVLADPVMLHASIREAAPAVWMPKYQAWFVGRDAEVREALIDWRRFSSAYGVGLRDIQRDGSWQKPSVILEVDPPDHTVTRRLLNRILSPKAMRTMRDEFERFAVALVDELVERRTFDAVQDLAWRFPATVLPDAVGLMPDGRDHLTRTARCTSTTASLATASPTRARPPPQTRTASTGSRWPAVASISSLARSATRSTPPSTPARSTTTRRRRWCARSSAAGSTRRCSGSASMIMLLATNPLQWDKLCGQPDLARAAFDETLRLTPPAPMVGRTTTGSDRARRRLARRTREGVLAGRRRQPRPAALGRP